MVEPCKKTNHDSRALSMFYLCEDLLDELGSHRANVGAVGHAGVRHDGRLQTIAKDGHESMLEENIFAVCARIQLQRSLGPSEKT